MITPERELIAKLYRKIRRTKSVRKHRLVQKKLRSTFVEEINRNWEKKIRELNEALTRKRATVESIERAVQARLEQKFRTELAQIESLRARNNFLLSAIDLDKLALLEQENQHLKATIESLRTRNLMLEGRNL